MVGEIRVTEKELDAIISADDAGREEEYLAYNGDTIDDVITCEDDVIDSGDEISTVEKEAYRIYSNKRRPRISAALN